MLKTKEEIENWLNKYEIENFFINEDLTVDVDGNVDLCGKELEEFPFQFGIIKGNFNCSHNKLISLKYSPEEINGYLSCAVNYLLSLKYSTKKITGSFNCSYNNLKSLEHCPKEIKGDFCCHTNELISLKYCPEKIEGIFYCSGNKLKKELLYVFNSNITDKIYSDFGNKEDFLNLVKEQKAYYEKEEITEIINSPENGQLTKKRL